MCHSAAPSNADTSCATGAGPGIVAIAEDGQVLHARLATGQHVKLKADRLRTACRCATCVRARIDGVFPESFAGVTITHGAPIGHYGINIVFSDGHARGIFPWSHLAGLAED